jgi:hypothetical protein
VSGGNRHEKAPHQMDSGGKRYAMLPIAVMDSEAYRHLSLRARAVLMLILKRFNFYNNAHPDPRRRLVLSAREIANELNNQNHSANREAIAELMSHSFIDVTTEHPARSRLAREFRITFAASGPDRATQKATNDYRHWRPDGVERRKKRKNGVAAAATESGGSVEGGSTVTKVSVDPVATGNRSLSQKGDDRSVEHVATQGSYQVEDRHPRRYAEPQQPLGTTDDAWRLAGINAAKNPVAPPAGEMRDRTIKFLVDAPRGTQRLLSSESRIPEGTLSRFINHEGPLAPRACTDLAAALYRLGARRTRDEIEEAA